MRGFYSGKTATQKIAEGYGANNMHPCESCGLYQGCINPYMPMGGKGKRRVLAIAEGPGATEDTENTQLVGDAGKLLEGYLAQYGINLHEDFYLTNAVNCRPPGNRTPKPKEIACCRGIVQNHIDEAQPDYIFLMGESAIKSFYGTRFSDTSVGRWRRLCIPDPTTGAWVIPLYHPSFALRSSRDRNKLSVYDSDLKWAVSCLNLPPPTFPNYEAMVEVSTDYRRIMQVLNQCIEMCDSGEYFYLVHDYEANSLRPWGVGKRLLSISLALADDWCFSFPVNHPHVDLGGATEHVQALQRLITDEHALKVAHNIPFEDQWHRVHLNIPEVIGWEWCTMNAAHVLDCRQGYSGLKFQAYINFGVVGYDDSTKKYKTNTYPDTDLNMLDQVPVKELLMYGGMDSILTRHLFNKQRAILGRPGEPRWNAYQFFHKGMQNLAHATYTGIPTDPIYYLETHGVLSKRIGAVEKKLLRGKVAKQFKDHTGRELAIVNKDFGSGDLRILLFDILKIKTTKQTDSGLKSVDKEVLADVKHPWVVALLERRKLHKILNTYLAQFIRGICDDHRLRPNFPLNTARTYRGSSADPNFQNIPIRDKESKQLTRHGVRADDGWRLAAVDYGSMEVRIAACCSKDPKLIWYCEQEGADMHQDIAERIWLLPSNEVSSLTRFHSKGGFVFAEIYGSFYTNCAVTMWEECLLKGTTVSGVPLRQHLKDVGLFDGADSTKAKYKIRGHLQTVPRHLVQFIEHVKGVEKWFWQEFGMLREWQEKLVAEYQSKGYVEMLFGFRRSDLLNNNKIFNTTIQGTAFHCLLWSFNHLSEFSRMWWDTQVIGEIHDEILYHMPDHELQAVFKVTERVMCYDIRERFDWINVPLVAEPEASPVGGHWTQMHEMVRSKEGLWVVKK